MELNERPRTTRRTKRRAKEKRIWRGQWLRWPKWMNELMISADVDYMCLKWSHSRMDEHKYIAIIQCIRWIIKTLERKTYDPTGVPSANHLNMLNHDTAPTAPDKSIYGLDIAEKKVQLIQRNKQKSWQPNTKMMETARRKAWTRTRTDGGKKRNDQRNIQEIKILLRNKTTILNDF